MDSLRPKYRLERLLRRFGLPKSTYEYHHAKREARDKYAEVKRLIVEIFEQSRRTYGYRRIRLALRLKAGLRLSGKTVLRLMRELGLKPRQPKRSRYRSYKKQSLAPEPNLLARDFESQEVCQKLVSDVTEFQVCGTKQYLSPLIDLFNGEVVGYSVSSSPTVSFVNQMFKGLKDRIPEGAHPLVHTDQGSQYWHKSYRQNLAALGAVQSMSRKGNCQDNAPAESFFGHLKTEFFYGTRFKSVAEFLEGLDDYIGWYNRDRIRCDLGGLSPVDYREQHQAARM